MKSEATCVWAGSCFLRFILLLSHSALSEKGIGSCKNWPRGFNTPQPPPGSRCCVGGWHHPTPDAPISFNHQALRGRGKGRLSCRGVFATVTFDWALRYVEWRTLLFTKRHPRKLQSRAEKLQVLILIRGACLPGVKCLSVKSRR